MKAKGCGGLPTDKFSPLAVFWFDKVTFPILTGIGGGAQAPDTSEVPQKARKRLKSELRERYRRGNGSTIDMASLEEKLSASTTMHLKKVNYGAARQWRRTWV
jgi:hypothetical protein